MFNNDSWTARSNETVGKLWGEIPILYRSEPFAYELIKIKYV